MELLKPTFPKSDTVLLGFGILAGVSSSDVWDVLNIRDADIPEAKILKMVKRTEVSLELELQVESDFC